MQYKVPQDVQREDTIIGPITWRQLIILAVGGGLAYGVYVSLSATYFIEVWLPPVAIIAAITLAFAFLKIHSLPFHRFLINLIEYQILARKRTWIQGAGDTKPTETTTKKKKEKKEEMPKKKSIKDLDEIAKVLDSNK